MPPIIWQETQSLKSKSYVCSYCGHFLASEKGYQGSPNSHHPPAFFIYLCHTCNQPTYFDFVSNQFPGPFFGHNVKNIPMKEVEVLYNEARNSVSVGAFTGSVLCSRKLLMSIAVSKGAKEGGSFAEYVDYLAEKGFVPPDGRGWVDHIRQKGNEATHQIAIMTREDAEDLITFVEALLRFIFEYPGMMTARKAKETSK